MKRFDFIKKIDYLFLFSILFFICFVILRYFIRNNLYCFFISFCCGYLLYSVLIKVITARGNKVLCKKQDLANIETLKTYMITCGTKNAINYLNTLVNGNVTENTITTTDSVYYLNTKSATLDLYSAAKISVTTTDKEKKLILISESVTEELIAYLNNNGYKVSFITSLPRFVALIPALSVSKDKNIRLDFVYLEISLTCSAVIAVPQDATAFSMPFAWAEITSK